MKGSVSHVIAGCFAMAAFVVAIIAGMSADIAAFSILTRAIISMLACYPIGLVIGMICQRVAQSHLDSYRLSSPVQVDAPASSDRVDAPPMPSKEDVVSV